MSHQRSSRRFSHRPIDVQLLEDTSRGTSESVADDALWPTSGWDTDDDPEQRARAERQFRVGRLREEHGFDRGVPFTATQRCKQCGGTEAFLRKVNGQNTVRCAIDNSLIYNAAKTETGELPRTARTLRRAIKPSQQARIFERDLRRCVLCGTDELPLTIGHLLSVEEGRRLGATLGELYSDANLAVMCEACNLGQSERSISPRMYAAIMVRLVQSESRRTMAPRPNSSTSTRMTPESESPSRA